MKVYEYTIEVSLSPAFNRAATHNSVIRSELMPVRELYGEWGQEKALIDFFWERGLTCINGENGYIGSYHNCAFRLLYAVFGLDILAYLFDKEWVPVVTIAPFRPGLFLERLSALERAAKKLNHGDEIPVKLSETTCYFKPGMGPEWKTFCEGRHRTLVNYSLRELRAFGELGIALQEKDHALSVHANIYCPELDDPEVDAFTAKP